MSDSKKENKRTLKTIHQLKETFRTMICEMDYEMITVESLTKRAGINRKTFYRHYSSLDALLFELQQEIAAEFLTRTEHLRRPEDIDQITRAFFEYSEEGGKLIERLILSNNYSYISKQITRQIMKNTWLQQQFHSIEEQAWNETMMTFVSESTLAIYRQWILGGRRIPMEQMIEWTTMLICNGINSSNKSVESQIHISRLLHNSMPDSPSAK